MEKKSGFERRITFFDTINSTHKYLKENYKFYNNGSIIVANRQTDGIGTKGHTWYTGDNNIALSILYKPDCNIASLEGLTVNVAIAMKNAIKKICDLNLEIKMPNDLIINNRKIAGILTEINTIGEKINFLIISVGANVNEEEFPNDIAEIATSLRLECGENFDKNIIIKEFINELENMIDYLRLS